MITSTSNAKIKQLVQLQKKSKVRQEQNVFVIEGIRMFMEVPKDKVKQVYLSASFYEKKAKELDLGSFPVEILADHVFDYVSDTKTPQGILCILERPDYSEEKILKQKDAHILVLDNLQDPGNLGTIMRTGEAAGVTGVLMSKDCVDIYNPKTIRSTMGAIYRMPFVYVEDVVQSLEKAREYGVHTYAAHLKGEHNYDEENYKGSTALLIGNEGNGLREEVSNMADTWIKIPMCGSVESLNAGVAASILMYEVFRQRRQ